MVVQVPAQLAVDWLATGCSWSASRRTASMRVGVAFLEADTLCFFLQRMQLLPWVVPGSQGRW